MKTIGAKELRLHLDQILDQVLGGEEVIINHRFKRPVRLSAVFPTTTHKSGKLSGLRAFDAAPKHKSSLGPDKSIKELYHESITNKYDN